MNINPKIKNALWIVFAVAIVAVCVIMFVLNPGPKHVEDTNGADNYDLQKITEQDIVDQKMGARGTVREFESHLEIAGWKVNDGIRYTSDKFTGVSMLYSTTLFKGSDIYVTLAEYEIKEGNFAFYIVFDGEVVGKILPGDGPYSEFLLENVDKTGTLEYVIAGESASFEFIAPIPFDEE